MSKRLLLFGVVWLFCAFPTLAQTNILNQKVSIHQVNSSVSEVLEALSTKYNLSFSYSEDLVPLKEKITIKGDGLPLHQVLGIIFKDTGIRYVLIGKQIVLQPALKSKGKKIQPNLSGYVRDISSGEALAGTTLSIRPAGSTTNNYGFYSLPLSAGEAMLEIRYLGYAPLQVVLPAVSKDTTITFLLQPTSSNLSEVEILSANVSDLEQANKLTMRGADIKQLPRLMGEADAVKALQLMPGVQGGKEGTSDLIVRGGSPDQNLILLDGVPVYNVSHLLGTFSIFNPDAIRNVELIKGGFPAPYGGRLSSVVDVQLKEGNNQRFAGEGAAGLMSSKLLLEGPIKNEKTAFLIAGRRTYLDLLGAAAAALSGESMSKYHFYDLNAKVNHTFSAKDRLYLSVYAGQDAFSDKQEFGDATGMEQQRFNMRWGNSTGALRWNHVFGKRLFSNLTLTHSRYGFSQNSENKIKQRDKQTQRLVDYESSIEDWGAKAEFDFAAGLRHSIRFGGSYTFHTFRPEQTILKTDSITLLSDSFSEIQAQEFYTYAEDRIQLGERLQVTTGVHLSGFSVNGKNFSSLQPRLAMGYTFPKSISVRASYATMAQYLHLLSNTATGTPTDIWAPATDKVKPQRSWQATLGAAKLLSQNQLELTSDLYYKEMKDVAEFRDGADFISDFLRSGPETDFSNFAAPPYETRIASGRGWSYGSEWMLRKRQGQTTGWVGYTLSWSWRQLNGINHNQKYPYTYDSRHSISVVANHQLTPKLSLGGSWVYRTGYVTTLPAAHYKAYNEPVANPGSTSPHVASVDYLGERNNYRMPGYHRLDLSLTHTKKKSWGERSWNISIYNAYNRKNPYFMQLSSPNLSTSSSSTRQLYQVSLFPILPSFSYGFKF
ncbi:TonB-dependent receptor [Adhaeribacter aquaticus]|uniref:TonB-dependent receptor n=1 Tax=Adhaeribacter aquaticus TaxID=299567 RepID=UPI0003FC682F|nr:TonB-dependent receptor [Adhaeribacter aquaticus]